MAKKDKAPEDEKPESEAAAAAPKTGLLGKLKSKKILMIAVPALVLVLAGGGAGAYFFLFKKDPTKEAKTEDVLLTPPTVAFSDLDKLTVNIQGASDTPAYLQLSVSLGWKMKSRRRRWKC